MAMQGLLANSYSDPTEKALSQASAEEIAAMSVWQAITLIEALDANKVTGEEKL